MSSQKLRVGFVMHVMQVAGAEVLVTQIIRQLAESIEPTVFCLDALGELGGQLREAGVPVVVLDRHPGLDRRVARRLAAEVRERKIEVLHAHQYTPFFYSALARMLYRAPARIVFTEHGRHYPDIVSPKRRWANRLVLQRYADVTTACCDFSTRALQTNEGFPAAVTLANGVDLTKLPPRGDAAEQTELRRRLGLDADRPYAACIARFHPVKDHATLIRGWQRVHQQLPNAKLLLVGDGPERQAIEHQIQQLSPLSPAAGERVRERGNDNPLSPAAGERVSNNSSPLSPAAGERVRERGNDSPLAPAAGERVRERGQSAPTASLPHCPTASPPLPHSSTPPLLHSPTPFASSIDFLGIRHDVADILRAVDVFTLTSVSEAASLTLLEAMASECPAVVTDVGGNGEHVTDGVEGYLVPRSDDAALADRLAELLSNPQQARQQGTAARRRVMEAFDLAGVIKAYGKVYEEVSCE